MPLEYWILFGVSWIAAFLSTPVFRRLATVLDITDHPNERKTHTRAIPYLGGLAFHVSLTAVMVYLFVFAPYILEAQSSGERFHLFSYTFEISEFSGRLLALYVISACFMILGICDDTKPISPQVKLIIQAILGVVLVGAGFSIAQLTVPFGEPVSMGWSGWFLSIFWILIIVNAINFIDGLDGLASGVVFFAALANLTISFHPWQNFVCVISLTLMGATLGFLPYNFSPARIFMGDAGSLYLGALLAGSSLASNVKGATAMSLSLPLVILTLPLLDTLLAIIRRGQKGRKFFSPDREHIHHRLLKLGFSDRQAVLYVYGLCFLLSMSAALANQLPRRYSLLFFLVFIAAVLWGLIVFSAFEHRLLDVENGKTLLTAQAERNGDDKE